MSNGSTKKRMNIHTIAKISILSALATILMLFEFPLPIAPPFYEMDFSEVVVLIGGFAMGPWAAVCIEGLKVLLNLILNGTITAGVGELGNFLVGCSFILPAVFIYQKKKSKKNAMIGLMIGMLCMAVVGALVNYYMLIPAFIAFANYPLDAILSAGSAIYPSIDSLFPLIVLCVVPFNLIKGLLSGTIVFLLYKKVSPLLHQ